MTDDATPTQIAELRKELAAERASRQDAQRQLEAMQEDAIRHQREMAQAVAKEREKWAKLLQELAEMDEESILPDGDECPLQVAMWAADWVRKLRPAAAA